MEKTPIQLEFDFSSQEGFDTWWRKNAPTSETPTFENWFVENTRERIAFGERPYTETQARDVYNTLITDGFNFKNWR